MNTFPELERVLVPDRPTVLHHHLGLGDHIICNGLVRTIVGLVPERRLWLVTKCHNVANVQRMYCDLPQVRCMPIAPSPGSDDRQEVAGLPIDWGRVNLLRVGFENMRLPHWDRSFYEQLGLPFELSWDNYHVERRHEDEASLIADVVPDGPFALVHDVGSAGHFPIRLETDLPIVRVTKRASEKTIFEWSGVVERASEVHCIMSSFTSIVDRLEDNCNQRLFMHSSRPEYRPYEQIGMKRNWTWVPYE